MHHLLKITTSSQKSIVMGQKFGMQFQLSIITIYLVDILSSSNVTKGFPEQSLDRLSSHICSANTLVDADTQAIKGKRMVLSVSRKEQNWITCILEKWEWNLVTSIRQITANNMKLKRFLFFSSIPAHFQQMEM